MPIISFNLPKDLRNSITEAKISYWCTETHHDELRFLNGANSKKGWFDQEAIEKKYYKNLSMIAESLAEPLLEINFDSIFYIPSSRRHSRELAENIKSFLHYDIDILDCFFFDESPNFGKLLNNPPQRCINFVYTSAYAAVRKRS